MLIVSCNGKRMYEVCVVNNTDMNTVLYLSDELEENVVMVNAEWFESIAMFEGVYEWLLKTGLNGIDTCFYSMVDSGVVQIVNDKRLEIDYGEQGVYCVWVEE